MTPWSAATRRAGHTATPPTRATTGIAFYDRATTAPTTVFSRAAAALVHASSTRDSHHSQGRGGVEPRVRRDRGPHPGDHRDIRRSGGRPTRYTPPMSTAAASTSRARSPSTAPPAISLELAPGVPRRDWCGPHRWRRVRPGRRPVAAMGRHRLGRSRIRWRSRRHARYRPDDHRGGEVDGRGGILRHVRARHEAVRNRRPRHRPVQPWTSHCWWCVSDHDLGGAVALTGGFRTGLGNRSGTYNITTNTAPFNMCDASGGAFTISLPNTGSAGYRFTIKKIDASANAVTVSAPIGIDGVPTRAHRSVGVGGGRQHFHHRPVHDRRSGGLTPAHNRNRDTAVTAPRRRRVPRRAGR